MIALNIIVVILIILILDLIIDLLILPRPLFNRLFSKKYLNKRKEDEDFVKMNEKGKRFFEEHKDKIENIKTNCQGVDVNGYYFNFNFKKTAIILGGRKDNYMLNLYYADLFYKNGYNILVYDQRGHGISDGHAYYIGYKEYLDLRSVINIVKDKYKINNVALFGTCVSAATIVHLLSKFDIPEVKTVILDSLYTSFVDMYQRHIPALLFSKHLTTVSLNRIFKKEAQSNLYVDTPIEEIKDLNTKVLMIYADKDKYIRPLEKETLFKNIKTKEKDIVILPNGAHSRIRIYNEKEYDNALSKFID